MGKKGNQKRIAKAKAASQKRLSSSNTTNTEANANNPPPNVPPTELLTNQNLQNSAAPAAALPRLQQLEKGRRVLLI